MECHQRIARLSWMVVAGSIWALGGLSVVPADEPVTPAQARDMGSRLEAKLERLTEINPRSRDLDERGAVRVPRLPRVSFVGPPVLERAIDCDVGQSITHTLSRAVARRVVLHLSGTCRESVTIDRPGVTLTGARSGTAVIDPPEDGEGIPIGPAIYAIGAHELTLEDLTLRGGTFGLEAYASRRVQLTRVNAIENTECGDSCTWPQGVYLNASEAVISDSSLSNNTSPLWVDQNSTAVVSDTVMENNSGDGPFSMSNSFLSLSRCRLLGNGLGPQAATYSSTRVYDSVVGSAGYNGWTAAWNTSELRIFRTEIHGRIQGTQDSQVRLGGVQFGTSSPYDIIQLNLSSNLFITDSSRDGSPVIGEINGNINLWAFSTATIQAEGVINGSIALYDFSDVDAWFTPILGSVECASRSRAFCNPHPLGGVHGCE